MSKVPGGSPNTNSAPNAIYTKAQIAAFVQESPQNAIDYAIQRNPTTVYAYIKQNYGNNFQNLKTGMEATGPSMESMSKFLFRQYSNLNPKQQQHWMWTLLHSLPNNPQVSNWTTPID